MRSSIVLRPGVARRLFRSLNLLCAALLCCGMIPVAAHAAPSSLELIPEGSQGAARVVSGAEGGVGSFSHCAADVLPSVDAGSAAIPSEDDPHSEPDASDGDAAIIDRDAARSQAATPDASASSDEESASSDTEGSSEASSAEERGTFYSDDARYNIVFDANGGDYAPTGAAYRAAFGAPMPSIESALHKDEQGTPIPPKRERYVFMGFYDGSDWTSSNRFYTKDFTVDGTCVRTYPYAADGLRLYAGWAPILDVTVPTSVSISVGTLSQMDAPSVASDAIVNRSPWPVRCTSLLWDDTEIEVSADDLVVNDVIFDASALDEMFSDGNGVYLTLSPVSPAIAPSEVQPGGKVALGEGSALSVAASVAGEEVRLPIDYSLRLAEGVEVKDAEKVSTTRLITPFEAVVDAPDPIRSTILFNPNGGEGGQSRSIEAAYGEALPVLSDPSAPLYEGREFLGWFDDPICSQGVRYYDEHGQAVEGVVWDKASACVLYAGWRTKGCTVVLVAGPEGSSASMDYDRATPSRTYEVAYGHPLSSIPGFAGGLPEPYWESDYAFCGWWSERTGGREVTKEEVITDYEAPTVLYGRWSGFPVAISWDACGGSAVDPWRSHPAGSALGTLPETQRAGYSFSGWFTSPTGGTKIEESTSVNDDATFYARWSANTITLSWDLDGTVIKTQQLYGEGSTVLLPSSIATPSKGSGWQFRGWYAKDESGDPEGERITATTPLPVQDASYTAFWEVEIAFDANGGAFSDGSIELTLTMPAGGSSKLSFPEQPTRAGYAFAGWEDALTSGVMIDEGSPVTAPATYYARWGGEEISFVFDANGGSYPNGGGTSTVLSTAGGTLLKPEGSPVRPGYDMVGWSTDPDGKDDAPSIAPAESTIYYAKWAPKTITISWSSQLGTSVKDTMQTYAPDAWVLLPETTPTRTGYAFSGWYTAAEGGEEVVADSTPLPSESIVYYAHWEPKTCPLVFNANGGSGTMPTGKYATFGFDMPAISGIPTRSGYRFLGYYDQSTGGVRYYSASLVSMKQWDKDTTDSVTLYAQWELDFKPSTTAPSGDDSGFYLYLSASDAAKVSSSSLTMSAGFYSATQIKSAAKDIASNGASSPYYETFMAILRNDIMFTGRWKNVSANNATSVLSTLCDYDIRLIGLRQDYTNASRTTYAGMTFQFADRGLSYSYRFNNAAVNATGWQDSELRARMNSANSVNCSPQPTGSYIDASTAQSIWNRAPSAITSNIQPVYKATHNEDGKSATGPTLTRDQMFIASFNEMVTAGNPFDYTTYPWIYNETVGAGRYMYWIAQQASAGVANDSMLRSFCSSSSPSSWSVSNWWQRSVRPGTTNDFLVVGSNGNPTRATDHTAAYSRGVVPCFCF